MSKSCKYATYLLYVVMLMWMFGVAAYSCTKEYGYDTYCVSDWLINYRGGFVRRGLIGEILYWAWQIVKFPPKVVINIIAILSFVLFIAKAMSVCQKLRITIFPVLAIMCETLAFINNVRRDWLMLFMSFYIFDTHAKWLASGDKRQLFLTQGLLALAIVIYEPTFFFTVPIMFVTILLHNNGQWLSMKKIVHCVSCLALPLLAFATSCIWKGNDDVAYTVWHSWDAAFKIYPDATLATGQISGAISFLGVSLEEAAKFHIGLNFLQDDDMHSTLWHIASFLLMLTLLFYMTIRNPQISVWPAKVDSSVVRPLLGNLMLVQIVGMLPLLTVLSCDYGRTVLYCAVPPIFMYYLLLRFGVRLHCPDRIPNVSALILRGGG